MRFVIGLVGEKGSGKETFAKILQGLVPDKKIAHIRFSDLLKETLNIWDIPTSRENLQKIAVVMKDNFKTDAVSHATYQRINNLEAEIVLVDGVRWETDVKLIKKFKKNMLVYITADLMSRFERLKKRNEKLQEEDTSFEQFMKEEKAENELLIPIIGAKADYKIVNNGTLKEFKEDIKVFAKKFL